MRAVVLLLASLALLSFTPDAEGAPTCLQGGALCAGEATQSCGGPSAYADGWDGFTGVWGEAAGVEYGAGGWDRCLDGDWAVGAFVNMDRFPLGGYQTVQARYDHTHSGGRDCYVSGGLYGHRNQYFTSPCALAVPDWNPGWGHVLS
jgi:hypothetical protein